MDNRKRTVHLIAGPIIFMLFCLTLSQKLGDTCAQAVGLLCWMIFWWIKRPVHITVTALLPLVVNGFCEIVPMSEVAAQYFNECVILLFGAGLLTLPWAEVGLDRRVSLRALSIIGPSVRSQIVIWYLVSVFFSSMLPNVVVCAIFTQLAILMLKATGYENVKECPVLAPILIAICWGVDIGGLGTPLGGAQNIISVGIFEEYTGQEFMYIDWIMRVWPYYIVGSLFLLVMILLIPIKVKFLRGSKEYFQKSYEELGPIKRDEIVCAVLFLTASLLAFTRPLYADILPALTPAFSFLTLGFLSFVLTDSQKNLLLEWETAQKGSLWDLFFMVGGAIALGTIISNSGITRVVLDIFHGFSLGTGLMTILFLTIVTKILTEFADSTTAAAVMIPIAFEFAKELGVSPIPYFFIVIMAYCGQLFLPIGVRAIPVAYGLDPKILMKYGVPVSLLLAVLAGVCGYLMMTYWPFFSRI